MRHNEQQRSTVKQLRCKELPQAAGELSAEETEHCDDSGNAVHDRHECEVFRVFQFGALKFAMQDHLGSGGNGMVSRVLCEQSGESLALKIQKKQPCESHEVYVLSEEYKFLASLRHPHIITAYALLTQPSAAILLELGEQDLRVWLVDHPLQQEQETASSSVMEARSKMTVQLIAGMHYMASKRILHGDLKPRNAIVTQSNPSCPKVKWTDFGCAREITDGNTVTVLPFMVYTLPYRPLELLVSGEDKAGNI